MKPSHDPILRRKQRQEDSLSQQLSNSQGKSATSEVASDSIRNRQQYSTRPVLPQHAAYLQRTIGNRHTRQLLESAKTTAGDRGQPEISVLQPVETNTLQRLVTYNGKRAKLNEEDGDFKKLKSTEQAEVRKQHQDRTQIFDYPDQSAFYAYIVGDTSKAPKIKPVDQEKLKGAKRFKNRRAFYRKYEKIGAPTDNPEFHKPEQKGMLPVWFPMSHTGLDENSMRWTTNPKSKQYELFKSKKLTATQNKELDDTSLTIIEEKGSGKIHWNANVGENPSSSFTDTNIKSRPTGKRKSEYGGKTLKDFAEKSVGTSGKRIRDVADHRKTKKRKKNPRLTRGHQQGYEDTITKPSKKERLILGSGQKQVYKSKIRTTDQQQEPLPSGKRPSTISPEQYDTGQHGRRTQIESRARKENGTYFEVNKLTGDSGTIVGGMDIPGEKYYVSTSKDRKTKKAGKIDQYANVYKEKEKAGGWNEYFDKKKINMDDVPQQKFFDSDEEIDYSDSENEPQTPDYMPEFMQTTNFISPVRLKLEQELGQMYQGFNDWIVTEELSNTNAGFQYQLRRNDYA